jgi:crotonobetainyl-CoA:carnitine CoA-transferase CaiB-like acyl-CoA transferase
VSSVATPEPTPSQDRAGTGSVGGAGPLAGLRVVDLTRYLAGPYVTRMLSDLGADVVKIEPPGGDAARMFGPHRNGESGYFVQQNVGKRGLCVDLTRPDGPDLVSALAGKADVVVENFRPGVLAGYGLDYASLSELNPALVMASITGFGQSGPEAGRGAFAGVVHAESGWLHRQAQAAGAQPTDSQFSVGDTVAGLHALVGLLAALRHRDLTGEGQHLDVAMIDAIVATDDFIPWAAVGDDGAHQMGGEVWEAPGGPIMVLGDFRWVWRQASTVLGLVDPAPPGADVPTKRTTRRAAWADHVRSYPDRPSLLADLRRARLVWGDVKSPTVALASPTLEHRGSLVDVEHGSGTWTVTRAPYRFTRSEATVRGPAPQLGQHNDEVVAEWLDLSAAEVDRLIADGTLVGPAAGDGSPAS